MQKKVLPLTTAYVVSGQPETKVPVRFVMTVRPSVRNKTPEPLKASPNKFSTRDKIHHKFQFSLKSDNKKINFKRKSKRVSERIDSN